MKKSWMLTVSAIFGLSLVLSACGGGNSGNSGNSSDQQVNGGAAESNSSGNSAEKVKLSILSWNNEKEMKPMLDSFQQKYPNFSFDFQTSPPVKDYIAKLQTMLLSDSATDIFVIAAENSNEVIDGGYALDLTDEPFIEGMLDSNKPMLSKNGKTYAYTQTGWVGGIFYNKELFKKAGIDKFPETWDDFIAVCKKLKEAGIIPIYDNIGDMPMLLDGLYANITLSKDSQFDEKIFSGKATFEQGWTEALQRWNEIVTRKIITPDMIGLSADQIVNEFATGNVAMIQGGPWNIPTLKQSNPNLQFEMAPIPAINPAEKWYAGAPGVGLAINSKTKNKATSLRRKACRNSRKAAVRLS
ncbi:ABC transporter substrate-binding protein [Paenibacillus solisilvae]|uniref:ABC transporter substrate-binding protein n=1 Tax=Paenibacillus solisilvae TaxID=2486751 RepID=A0ABW0W9P8_9BACL